MQLRRQYAAAFWFAWPRSDWARSALVTALLLLIAVAGWSLYLQKRDLQAHAAELLARQQFDQRLSVQVTLEFDTPPTLRTWLDEWSRQAGIKVILSANLERTFAHETVCLNLPAMPAREALELLRHATGHVWLPEPQGSLSIVGGPLLPEPELRGYTLPEIGVTTSAWGNLLSDAQPAWFKQQGSLTFTPGALHILQQRSKHLEIEAWLAGLTAAEHRVRHLPAFYSVSAAAEWKPIFVGDERAMEQALTALQRRIDVDFQEVSLEEVAWQLSKQVGFPVLLEKTFEEDYPHIHPATIVSCRRRNATLQCIIDDDFLHKKRFREPQLRIVPIAGGRALAIRSAEGANNRRDDLTYLYPVADLLRGQPQLHIDQLTATLMHLAGQHRWDRASGGDSLGGGLFGDSLVITHSLSVHQELERLLTAIRHARSGVAAGLPKPELRPLEKLLTQRAELIYVDAPLKEVVADLQQRFQVPIQLSNKVQYQGEADGFQPRWSFWCHLPAQPLGENLARLLAAYDLTYIVYDDHILVSSLPDTQQPREERGRMFDVHNLSALAGEAKSANQIELLLQEFGDDQWRPHGFYGQVWRCGDLLILKHHPEQLEHMRPILHTLRAEALRSPAQVAEQAIRNRSAPFLREEQLRTFSPEHVSNKRLQQRLEALDSLELQDTTVGAALLEIAKKHQLPVVCPGSIYVAVELQSPVSLRVQNQPVREILQQLLPAESNLKWVIFNGQLQTWNPHTGAGVQERWLFNVADLLEPAGPLLPGQLLRTLDGQIHRPPERLSDANYALPLGRFLAVHARLEECAILERSLHELRTGQLPALPRQADDKRFVQPSREPQLPLIAD